MSNIIIEDSGELIIIEEKIEVIQRFGMDWGDIGGDLFEQTDLQEAFDSKVDEVAGKGLSTNDFTDDLETKLNGIEENAQVNVQADWDETDSREDSYINNKPTIPRDLADLREDDNHLTVTVFEKEVWNAADPQVQADWDQDDSDEPDYINNKPAIPAALADLSDDTTHRLVTDTEKGAWNDKQDNLHFSPEDVDNKVTTWTATTTDDHYPSEKLVKGSLDNKVDEVAGKGLSTNDFTDDLETKLDGIEEGAQANVQANWGETEESEASYIRNKPDIKTSTVFVDAPNTKGGTALSYQLLTINSFPYIVRKFMNATTNTAYFDIICPQVSASSELRFRFRYILAESTMPTSGQTTILTVGNRAVTKTYTGSETQNDIITTGWTNGLELTTQGLLTVTGTYAQNISLLDIEIEYTKA